MPRTGKLISESGYYHIIVRGNGKQILFENDSDRQFYLEYLHRLTSEAGIAILAWCLMDSHGHVIIDDPSDRLSEVMRRVNGTYAQRYNNASEHVGHVFQGRYVRRPINSDAYLLELVRYVHNNPEKARICPADKYRWSSYREYVGVPFISETAMVLEMLGGPKEFRQFCQERVDPAVWLASELNPDTETLMMIAREALGGTNPMEVGSLNRVVRNQCLQKLRETGFSLRQIERLTGLGKSTIANVTVDKRDCP